MKSCSFLLLIVFCNAVVAQNWETFKRLNKKKYLSASEEIKRKAIYMENQQAIDNHNQKYDNGQVNFRMKMNQFGDMTQEEFQKLMNGLDLLDKAARQNDDIKQYVPRRQNVPSSINWVQKGAVTEVKNQGPCGSCWAFSATGSLEGQYFLNNRRLVGLSEQQLIDCSRGYGNNGCQGGHMNTALRYLRENIGIQSESSYPYEGQDKQCRFNKTSVVTTVIQIFHILKRESMLKKAVAFVGPISAAIDAGLRSFQFYSSGIYSDDSCSSENLTHGILVVGFGEENGQEYWLVKNSYGTEWGEQGYFKLARNKNNMCGITSLACYPYIPEMS